MITSTHSHKHWTDEGGHVKVTYGPTDTELNSLVFRRSIYASEDISAGDNFTNKNIRIIRPGDGMPPHMYEKLLNRKSSKNYKRGEPITIEKLL